jgi:hypothetical protein
MKRLATRLSVLVFALAALAPFLCAPALADGVGNFCPSGTCVIDNPVYVNVYWIAGPTEWNGEVGASSGMTTDLIDKYTAAIIHSGYFAPLSQYQVYAPTFLFPSMFCVAVPPPASMDDVEPLVKFLVDCVFAQNPSLNNGKTILNLFLPPETTGANWCTQRSAKHDKFGSPVEVTIEPTNSACNNSFAGLLESLSHEMVEAATDPIAASATGYKNKTIGSQFGQEIGDLCKNLSFSFMGVGGGHRERG